MGFFNYIGSKMKEFEDETNNAELKAQNWDAYKICRELSRTSSMAISSGYGKALRAKARQMDDYELKDLFDSAYNSRNTKACSALMNMMENRGLGYKDDDGKFHRNY